MSKYRYTSPYYPPCSGRLGYMFQADEAIVCCRPPGHKGAHHNNKAGARWGYPNERVVPCRWSGCADPMRLTHDGFHLCPGGEAERVLGETT